MKSKEERRLEYIVLYSREYLVEELLKSEDKLSELESKLGELKSKLLEISPLILLCI